jgi:hypothetical protein
MDRVYRIFQKGEDAATGEVVTGITIKSIITQPLKDAQLPAGWIPIRQPGMFSAVVTMAYRNMV